MPATVKEEVFDAEDASVSFINLIPKGSITTALLFTNIVWLTFSEHLWIRGKCALS